MPKAKKKATKAKRRAKPTAKPRKAPAKRTTAAATKKRQPAKLAVKAKTPPVAITAKVVTTKTTTKKMREKDLEAVVPDATNGATNTNTNNNAPPANNTNEFITNPNANTGDMVIVPDKPASPQKRSIPEFDLGPPLDPNHWRVKWAAENSKRFRREPVVQDPSPSTNATNNTNSMSVESNNNNSGAYVPLYPTSNSSSLLDLPDFDAINRNRARTPNNTNATSNNNSGSAPNTVPRRRIVNVAHSVARTPSDSSMVIDVDASTQSQSSQDTQAQNNSNSTNNNTSNDNNGANFFQRAPFRQPDFVAQGRGDFFERSEDEEENWVAEQSNKIPPSITATKMIAQGAWFKPKKKERRAPAPLVHGKATRVKFSNEEDLALLEGIRVYGLGNWSVILAANQDAFHTKRNSVALKDRWRNIVKDFYKKFPQVQEQNEQQVLQQLHFPGQQPADDQNQQPLAQPATTQGDDQEATQQPVAQTNATTTPQSQTQQGAQNNNANAAGNTATASNNNSNNSNANDPTTTQASANASPARKRGRPSKRQQAPQPLSQQVAHEGGDSDDADSNAAVHPLRRTIGRPRKQVEHSAEEVVVAEIVSVESVEESSSSDDDDALSHLVAKGASKKGTTAAQKKKTAASPRGKGKKASQVKTKKKPKKAKK